ncbi:hypothetical protein [Hydrogenophaga sp. 5NK40-0174]|uniref:hypothetical protein n=1 Tax=Hydrogenophaga sp. 5NK40-0174 TaxID=3127649 RepID=UPI003108F377
MPDAKILSLPRLLLALSAASVLAACVHTPLHPGEPRANKPAEYDGRVMPVTDPVSGQAVHELVLDQPVPLDDQSTCGAKTVKRMVVDAHALDALDGQHVRVRATAFCKVNGVADYRLRNISVIRSRP